MVESSAGSVQIMMDPDQEAQNHTDPGPEQRLKVAAHVFHDDPLLNQYQMRN
jgi:hypothetical protein